MALLLPILLFCPCKIGSLEEGDNSSLVSQGRLVVTPGSNQDLSDYRAQALMTALSSSFMPGSEASGLHTLDSRGQIGLESPAWTGIPAQPHDSLVSPMHLFSGIQRRLVSDTLSCP